MGPLGAPGAPGDQRGPYGASRYWYGAKSLLVWRDFYWYGVIFIGSGWGIGPRGLWADFSSKIDAFGTQTSLGGFFVENRCIRDPD